MGAADVAVLDGLNTNAAELRSALHALNRGVLTPSDFRVLERPEGANRSITLTPGRAVVENEDMPDAGNLPMFMCPKYMVAHDLNVNSDLFEAGGFAAPHSTYDRLDQVVLRVYDNFNGARRWRPEILKGADPTQDATHANRHGAIALGFPSSVIRVADVIVPVEGIITQAHIRDRRLWASGAFVHVDGDDSANLTTNQVAWTPIAGGYFRRRIECSGRPIKVSLRGKFVHNAVNGGIYLGLLVNGALLTDTQLLVGGAATPANFSHSIHYQKVIEGITPGSYTIEPAWAVLGGGQVTLGNDSGIIPSFTIDEEVRYNAHNGIS